MTVLFRSSRRLFAVAVCSVALAALLLETGAASANPDPPVATTGPATGISQTSATLTGTVDPNNEATTYYFEYGTTTSYGSTTPVTTVG